MHKQISIIHKAKWKDIKCDDKKTYSICLLTALSYVKRNAVVFFLPAQQVNILD